MEYGTILTTLRQMFKTRHEQKHKRKEKQFTLEDPPSPALHAKRWNHL